MLRHSIPTPRSWVHKNLASIKELLSNNQDWPIVVKASEFTGGKGVILAMNEAEALHSAAKMLSNHNYEGTQEYEPCLLLEEYHGGPEFSVVALTDGTDLLMLPPIKDYKRRGNGDTGPNTGGMGCVSPTTLCPDHVLELVKHNILVRILRDMQAEGKPFAGVLCIYIILTEEGPVVIDIDTRFGDAETQTLLPLLDDATDLMVALLACVVSGVSRVSWQTTDYCCVSVVAATDEYPEKRSQEFRLTHSACHDTDTLIFLGASKKIGEDTIAFGGRVLTVVAVTDSREDAADRVRHRLENIAFPGMYFKIDIGSK